MCCVANSRGPIAGQEERTQQTNCCLEEVIDNRVLMEDEIIIDDDEDLEIEEIAALEEAKKGGRKAAAKCPAPTKKRGPAKQQQQAVGQQLLTQMLNLASENSPQNKVRKMRASPVKLNNDEATGSEEISSSSPNTSEEMTEVVRAEARPQRANSRQARYVLNDSESEKANEDSDFNEDED